MSTCKKRVLLALVCGLIAAFGSGCRWTNEAVEVGYEEAGPRAIVRKYEKFKDMAAALDAKKASISVYEGRMKTMKDDYRGKARSDWPREDREQYNLWTSELAGITASYNLLAADYNAAMSKDNWSFTNVGNLPPGAKALPREFREYVEK